VDAARTLARLNYRRCSLFRTGSAAASRADTVDASCSASTHVEVERATWVSGHSAIRQTYVDRLLCSRRRLDVRIRTERCEKATDAAGHSNDTDDLHHHAERQHVEERHQQHRSQNDLQSAQQDLAH
jgi:hypothetical protein